MIKGRTFHMCCLGNIIPAVIRKVQRAAITPQLESIRLYFPLDIDPYLSIILMNQTPLLPEIHSLR